MTVRHQFRFAAPRPFQMRAEMQGAGSGPAADRRPVAPPGPCTTISRSIPSRTTSRPISSCALFVSAPSSAISPSTAQDRRPRPMIDSDRRAAFIECGLAL